MDPANANKPSDTPPAERDTDAATARRVDAYVAQRLAPPDAALEAAVADSAAAGLPDIAVSPCQGQLLHVLARSVRASRVLEIGTLGGYSTIWLARALPSDGRLVTLEAEAKHADVARHNLERAGVAPRVDVRIGPALESLPQLEGESPFDFVFIDADKPTIPDYYAWARKLTRPGSLIVVDNVVRRGELANPDSTDAAVLGCQQLVERLATDDGVAATVVQTVGVKGHDGLALITVL